MSKMLHRRSVETSSDASYCEREPWDEEWGSRSTLSQLDEEVCQQVSTASREDVTLRAERDALARALSAERAKAAAAARAHDARLAELHGVIAELVRRRAADKHKDAIPEEDASVSDECESTTQPAGENDNDADGERSRTDQNDTSSPLSPAELPTPQEHKSEDLPKDTTDTSTTQEHLRVDQPVLLTTTPADEPALGHSEDELCLNTARCCQSARAHSCEREHGSAGGAGGFIGRSESRQAKLASRVRLRRTEDTESQYLTTDEAWCGEAAERLAREVRAQAEYREALAGGHYDAPVCAARAQAWRARCSRLQADVRVLRGALARAADTAHRYCVWCARQESAAVALCGALRAADAALEAYDVLLALAETAGHHHQRASVERVALCLLSRLDAEQTPTVGEPLLSPGPWLQHENSAPAGAWSAACEARLRAHAARLKADTVALRHRPPPPALFTHHDSSEDEVVKSVTLDMAEMEHAVRAQEILSAREAAAVSRAAQLGAGCGLGLELPPPTPGAAPRRPRHWLWHSEAAETDL